MLRGSILIWTLSLPLTCRLISAPVSPCTYLPCGHQRWISHLPAISNSLSEWRLPMVPMVYCISHGLFCRGKPFLSIHCPMLSASNAEWRWRLLITVVDRNGSECGFEQFKIGRWVRAACAKPDVVFLSRFEFRQNWPHSNLHQMQHLHQNVGCNNILNGIHRRNSKHTPRAATRW